MPQCPGQDWRYWTPRDILEVACSNCGHAVEIWRDEPVRICSVCGQKVRNPRLDLGCAASCKYAAECLGSKGDEPPVSQVPPDHVEGTGESSGNTHRLGPLRARIGSSPGGRNAMPSHDTLLQRLQSDVLVFDGAMGTMLFQAGLGSGSCPELWNAERPDVLQGIHRAYIQAGSDLIETNTFGGTRLKLKAYGLEDRCRELNEKAARLARSVSPPGGYVAGSIGPTGHLPDSFAPLGDTPAELFSESFREQALALAEGGVDCFAIETMMIPDEAVLAIKAAKEVTDLPVMCSMTFQYSQAKGIDRTMWGTSPAQAAAKLTEAGADIVACNCGDGGPGRVPAILVEMRTATRALLGAYPNAGIPQVVGDKTLYDLTPEAMAAVYPAILDAGARIVGACCGSTPAHIRKIAEVVRRHSGK